jgi:hypothetical protein
MVDAEEGTLDIGNGKVKLTPHPDTGGVDTELQLSDVDSVLVTRSDVRPVARVSVLVKGSERLAATIPVSDIKSTLRALTLVKEDAVPKTADHAERRTTEPEDKR